jgi:hypothetical protein
VLRSYIRFIPACSRNRAIRTAAVSEGADGMLPPVEPGLSSLKDWTGEALHSLHEPYRNALTANCTSRQPSLPVAAIHSAVFNFAPAQGVVVQTGRSLLNSSNRLRGQRSQPSLQVGRPGQRDSQRGRPDLAEIAIVLLLVVRKTFARAPGARPSPQ